MATLHIGDSGPYQAFAGRSRPRAVTRAALLTALAVLGAAAPAWACGGFFCFTQPVDQSAERILYLQQGNKMTVHIQISYTGDDEKFSWVLPLQKVPDLTTGSDTVFQILEQWTAPTFQLNWKAKEGCEGGNVCEFDATAGGGTGGGGPPSGGGVQVLKEELVGPYKSVVIAGNSGPDLVKWLNDNGYVQPTETTPLVDAYAKQGYVFLALQLQKDKAAGDLVPIVVTVEETAPCLPLRLTKLAATPDMPIVAWVLGDHRAIPKNFLHVVLHDAVLDWLQPGTNYKTVVSKAVDQASGHAFVTEMAGKHTMKNAFYPDKGWNTKALAAITDVDAFLMKLLEDGYPRNAQLQALIRKFIPKPAAHAAVPDSEFYNCLTSGGSGQGACATYKAAVKAQPFDSAAFANAIQVGIVEPLFVVQGAFDALPYLTRLYTTVSPDEMNKDPIFAFNPTLPDVDRKRVATAEPICPAGTSKPTAAKLTFADGTGLEVQLTKDWNSCGWFDSTAAVGFGQGKGPLVAGGGQPALRVEVLDEQGPPIEIDPRVADLVDAALNDAKVGQPSLTAAFLAKLPQPSWNPKANVVDPLPGSGSGGGQGDATGSGGGTAPASTGAAADGGCNVEPARRGTSPSLLAWLALVVGAGFLTAARRRGASRS